MLHATGDKANKHAAPSRHHIQIPVLSDIYFQATHVKSDMEILVEMCLGLPLLDDADEDSVVQEKMSFLSRMRRTPTMTADRFTQNKPIEMKKVLMMVSGIYWNVVTRAIALIVSIKDSVNAVISSLQKIHGNYFTQITIRTGEKYLSDYEELHINYSAYSCSMGCHNTVSVCQSFVMTCPGFLVLVGEHKS